MLVDLLTNTLTELLADIFGVDVKQLRDKRAIHRALTEAIQRAEKRFGEEYRDQDDELVDVLTVQTRFADLPSVKAALHQILSHPFHDPSTQVYTLRQSFVDVLPEYTDRRRIESALSAFLSIVGQEVLLIPQLQQTYSLMFQRTSAESSRDVVANTAALLQSVQGLRADVQQLPAAIPPALPEPASRPLPWHNLPRRTYSHFVGRQQELKQLAKLMLPYPRSRHFAVTLDGIGGVGKSALALEFAHRHREHYAALPVDERFEAIVWVTAKRTLLTASGIQQRQQTFSTLGDLYRQIANVLETPTILQIDMEQQRTLVERALSDQRTLLVIDNLETVDDEELLTFIRELPDPTKVLVTTRHRIDIAMPIRVLGMPYEDAQELMAAEAASKQIELFADDMDNLFRRTAGVPLALVWSIALMSLGHGVKAVLRRLGSGHSDIARFCFTESIEHIRGRDAYSLLLALALFDYSVNRVMLGEVAGLGDDEIGRDDGLADLERLSLVNKEGDRFNLLPLTYTFALDELKRQPEMEAELRERWIDYLMRLAKPYNDVVWRRPDRQKLRQEGRHLVTLANWSRQVARPDILLSIITALRQYYEYKGQWNDAIEISQIALEQAKLIDDKQTIVLTNTWLAWVLSQQGYIEDAVSYIQTALSVSKQTANMLWKCEVLHNYSVMLRRYGELEQSIQCCQEALQIVSTLPETQQGYVRADIEYEMGKIARDQGDWETALFYFRSAQNVFPHDEDSPPFNSERAWAIFGNTGFVLHQLGESDEAFDIYKDSLDFFIENGCKDYLATIYVRLASLEEQRSNLSEAFTYAWKALEWGKRLGIVQEQMQAEAIISRLEAGAL